VTRRTLTLAAFGLVVACQALPSSVPLSNTGGVLFDTGTDRDKRPQASSSPLSLIEEKRPSASTSIAAPPPSTREATPDAGLPDTSSASGDAGLGTPVWPGEYYGSDKLTRHFDADADDVELDDKAHTRVEEKSSGSLVISIVNSATGELICALRATAQGGQATVDSGQSCFGEEGMTATVTDGRASVSGDRLVLDFNGKVVESDDEDDDPLEFRLDYHFDGRRR
jgi:hypothetical protein